MHRTARENTVAVVAYHGISPFHLAVPCMVFGEDLARLGAPRYRLLVCSAESEPVQTMAGFSIQAEHGLEGLDEADTVIMPAWRDPNEKAPKVLLDALRRAHERGARVVGLCLGAFVLAEAGLLDGRSASTHWAWLDEFAAQYPKVLLERDVLYVDEGDIFTSAGTAAAIDACLHIIRRDHGAEVANRVARRMVVAPHRRGGQAQYIELPLPKASSGDHLTGTLEWAQANLGEPLCVDSLAGRAAMSRRTFTRRFRAATGSSVSDWLLSQRLAQAQRLLETSDQSVDRVAEACGFGSSVSLRQHFTRAFSTSPASYRRAFRGP
jgi:transcriptional regulator GlxA family with amidase domain